MAEPGVIRAGRAAVEAGLDDSALVKGLRGIEGKIRAAGTRVQSLGQDMLRVGLIGTTAFAAATKIFADAGSTIFDMSQRTGIAADQLSILDYAAKQVGSSTEALQQSLRSMQRNLVEGSKETGEALARLGLHFYELERRSTVEQLGKLADAFSRVRDDEQKTAAAMAIFGRSGAEMLPLLSAGQAGLAGFAKDARRLGLVLSPESAARADELGDSFTDLWETTKSLARAIGEALAPAMQSLVKTATEGAASIRDWAVQNKKAVDVAAIASVSLSGIGVTLTALGVAANSGAKILGWFSRGASLAWSFAKAIGSLVRAAGPLAAAYGGFQYAKYLATAPYYDEQKRLTEIQKAALAEKEAAEELAIWQELMENLDSAIREANVPKYGQPGYIAPPPKPGVYEPGGAPLTPEQQAGAVASLDPEKLKKNVQAAAEFEAKAIQDLHRARIEAIEDEEERELARIEYEFQQSMDRLNALQNAGADVSKAQAAVEEERAVKRDAAERRSWQEAFDTMQEIFDEQDAAEEELAARREELDDEVERARIEATLRGREKELALLEHEKAVALRGAEDEAAAAQIERLFGYRRQMLYVGAEKYAVTGTFSARAAMGLGGSGTAERTATATEQTARHVKKLVDKAQPLVFSA